MTEGVKVCFACVLLVFAIPESVMHDKDPIAA